MRRERMRGSSPIVISAALSIAILIAAFGVQLGSTMSKTPTVVQADMIPMVLPSYVPVEDADSNGVPDWQDALTRAGISLTEPPDASSTASSSDSISSDPLSSIAGDVVKSLYGGYLSLKQSGEYSAARGIELANSVALNMRAPKTFTMHTAGELTLDSDVSIERVLAYRADMREATAPMITDEGPEFETFAQYLSTHDPSWLLKLQAAAERYRTVEGNMLALTIPKDAAPEHLRSVNAVGAYASTLERLSVFGDDALASAALLRTYNENEQEMLLAFDALAKYYVRKVTI